MTVRASEGGAVAVVMAWCEPMTAGARKGRAVTMYVAMPMAVVAYDRSLGGRVRCVVVEVDGPDAWWIVGWCRET